MTTPTGAIIMAEMQPGEREYLEARVDWPTRYYECAVEECPAADYTDGEVLSMFVHSKVTAAVLDAMPELKLVATRSTGYDHIDLASCAARGIPVCNVPRYGENTVAEHTFGLMLTLTRNIHKAYLRTVAGDFSLKGLEGTDIKGKTLGVVGTGSIGLHVIRTAIGFGMNVIAYDVKPNPVFADVLGYRYASLDDLLAQSDIISMHAPYLPATHHLINKENIARIKRGAILINTARGGLVDTEALIDALDQGILAGAGLDVFEGEELMEEEERLMRAPEAGEQLRMLVRQHILLRRPDVVITPHIAFFSKEARERILDTTIANIQAFYEGHPRNVVNGV